MRPYSLTHLGDRELLRDLATLVAQDRKTTALVLAHIAEVDARRLFLEAVTVLASYLTEASADRLLQAAEHKTRAEVEQLIAERFPGTELLPLVEVVPATSCQLAPARVSFSGTEHGDASSDELEPYAVAQLSAAAPSRVECVAPQRFALHVSIGQATRDKLRRAQELLGHQVGAGFIATVLDRALDTLIEQCERQRFAATSRPQHRPRPTNSVRHIPARDAAAKRAAGAVGLPHPDPGWAAGSRDDSGSGRNLGRHL